MEVRYSWQLLAQAAAAVAVVTLIGAGCGSSSKHTSTPTTASSGGGGTPAKQATGTPLVAVSVQGAEVAPDDDAGITAATKAINAAGGIDGHPIQVKTCMDNNDPNTAATCIRKAISDPATLASVDTTSPYGTSFDAVLQPASMANIGLLFSNTADQNSPESFGLTGGTFSTIASAAAAVKLLGAKRIGVPYIGIPAGAQLPPFISKVVRPLGATVVGAEAIPPTVSDATPYAAAELAAKPDLVVDGQTANMYTTFIKAVLAQGGKTTFMISTGVFDAGQIKSLLGTSADVVFVDEYNHAAPGYQAFLHDMSTYNNSYQDRNDSVLSGWLGVEAFAEAAKGVLASGKPLNRANITAYMRSETDFDVQGLTGGVNFTKPNTALGGSIPRVIANAIWLEKFENGKEVPVSGKNRFALFPNA